MSASIPYIRELVKTYDFVLISEHWLHSNRLRRFEDIGPNISYFARASDEANADSYGSSRGEGGVAILWQSELKGVTPLREVVHDRFCGVHVQVGEGKAVNIFSVYMPAKGCKGDMDVTLDELAAVIENTDRGTINIIGGDLNGDVGRLGGPRALRDPTSEGRKVFNFARTLGLSFVNLNEYAKGPVVTHCGPTGSTCIDYILVPEVINMDILECGVIEEDGLNTSDHYPVYVKIDLMNLERQSIEVESARNVRWNKLQKDVIKERYTDKVNIDLTKLESEMDRDTTDVNMIDSYVDKVVYILKKHERNLPKSKFKQNVKPFWNAELTELKHVKVEMYRRWKDAGRPRDREDATRTAHITAKKAFAKALIKISKAYENERIEEVVRSAEINKNHFWNLLKKERKGDKVTISTIKNLSGKVVSDPVLILEVWRRHFDNLSTPKMSPQYDNDHYEYVREQVKTWYQNEEEEKFLLEPFNISDIEKGINTLHKGKTPGHDLITRENLDEAGPKLKEILVVILNLVVRLEYIPVNFRRGIQIPLYKGKNAPPLDTNSYRGITLLSTLNKLFEVLIWQRMEKWWNNNQVITQLQGACRKKVSCIHTAMLLQETIAEQLENNNKVFVAYYDVAKAFDGVWIDGLFFRLHEMGVVGKTWRLLYKTYMGFKCRV